VSRIYLYLAGRNRRGVRVLATMTGENVGPTRVNDLTDLGLPAQQVAEINSAVRQNRMDYELWAESAENATELAANLKARGYSKFALSRPELTFGNCLVTCNHRLPDRTGTMLRKGHS
jgi:hypothetical protein